MRDAIWAVWGWWWLHLVSGRFTYWRRRPQSPAGVLLLVFVLKNSSSSGRYTAQWSPVSFESIYLIITRAIYSQSGVSLLPHQDMPMNMTTKAHCSVFHYDNPLRHYPGYIFSGWSFSFLQPPPYSLLISAKLPIILQWMPVCIQYIYCHMPQRPWHCWKYFAEHVYYLECQHWNIIEKSNMVENGCMVWHGMSSKQKIDMEKLIVINRHSQVTVKLSVVAPSINIHKLWL